MVLQDNTSAAATVAPATITVDNLLNAAEAVRAVEVRISLSEGDTIDSAKIGDTDLTVTDGAYSFDATELDDGTYTITVVTQDIDGNQSTATQTVTIDKTVVAPTVALATDSGTVGDDEITNDATLSLTNVETGATVEYQVGEGEWGDYDPDDLADGEHTVNVRVTDAAGNLSDTSTITFNLDTTVTAPTVALTTDSGTAGDDEITNDATLSLTGVETGATVEYQVGDGEWSTDYNPASLADGEHTVRVRVRDAAGNLSEASEITFNLDRLAPTGVTLSNDEVSETADVGDVVGTLAAVDQSTTGHYTYTIVDANGEPVDDSSFEIVENDLGVYEVRVKAALDHEEEGEHTIRVKVSDGANAPHIQTITITITDENDNAPEDILRSGGLVAEKAAVGKEFATLSAVDDDEGDTFTYTLVTDESGETPAQNEFFEIAGNKIRVKAALNDAQVGLQELWVKVTDAAGHSYVESVTIGVYNTEEAPENVALLNQTAVDELAANGTVVGTLSATDQDNGDHVAFRLVDDAGGRFEVANGQIVVKNGLKLDYEQARTHKVTVEAKDNEGLVTLKTFTINLANVDPEVVNGTAASETFFGGAGRDVLNGGAGNDILAGGLGNDVLTGGDGRDSFVFNTALNGTKNVDTIKSFSVKDDTIRLENAIFKKLTKTGTLSKDSFIVGDKAKDSKDYVVYNKKTGALSYDADGSGRGAAIKIAQLDKDLAMTAADFFVI